MRVDRGTSATDDGRVFYGLFYGVSLVSVDGYYMHSKLSNVVRLASKWIQIHKY